MSEVEASRSGDTYRYQWAIYGLVVTLGRLRESRGGWQAELTVRAAVEGEDRLLTQGVVPLSSLPQRAALAHRLARLHAGPPWDTVVETVCVRTIAAHRRGDPAILIEPAETDGAAWLCHPILYDRHPTLIYGPGESGKSLLALWLAALLATGGTSGPWSCAPDGHRVLYLDWEMRPEDLRQRFALLRRGHPELVHGPWYRRMTRPLDDAVPEVAEEIARIGAGVLVIDSLGLATGGEIERSTDPLAFFAALQALGVPALVLGHVAKGASEEDPRTPYGSVYYFNLMRSVWEMRLVSEPGAASRMLALYHRKNNLGPRLAPLGFRLTLADGAARYEAIDPGADPDLAVGLGLPDRIAALLADRVPRATEEIAEALGSPADAVRRTLARYAGHRWVRLEENGRGRGHSSTWTVP